MTVEQLWSGDGRGKFGFRLEVEGWPCFFVTNPEITFATYAEGRVAVQGLSFDKSTLNILQRIVLHEATLQCNGLKFAIVPSHVLHSGLTTTDPPTFYLSQETDPVDELAVAVDDNDTAFTFKSGSTYAAGAILHIGTEVIRSNGDGTYDRHVWGTHPQAHPLESFGQATNVYVYSGMPTTMEGRRVTLCKYGEGDNFAGDGGIVWCGMVAAVPSLAPDGRTWIIDCEARTQVLKQDIAGGIAEAHVIGIYHHNAAPFLFFVTINDTTPIGPFYYSGHARHEAEMLDAFNALIASTLVTAGIDDLFDSAEVIKNHDGTYLLQVVRSDVESLEVIHMYGGSIIVGFFGTLFDGRGWRKVVVPAATPLLFASIGKLPTLTSFLEAEATYVTEFAYDQVAIDLGYTYSGAPVSPLGPTNILMKWSPSEWLDQRTSAADQSPFRVYVDIDLSGVDVVHIAGTAKTGGIFEIADTGVDDGKNYFEIVPVRGTYTFTNYGGAAAPKIDAFLGFLGAQTTITVVRQYGAGNLGDFVAALKLAGITHGNAGDTPFITDSDLADFTVSPSSGISPLALFRVFAFAKKKTVEVVLQEELKFNNCVMRVGVDGIMEIIPLPRWTETSPVDEYHQIGPDHIIPRKGGVVAEWSPNKDGVTTQVELQHEYDAIDDKHRDAPVIVYDVRAIARSKGRGKASHTIKPFSAPFLTHVFRTAMLAEIGKTVLAFSSGIYGVISFTVPYNKYRIYCGDIVAITHQGIVAGDGTRGLNGRRGVVIEKRVNLDPASERRIDLTVQLTGHDVIGYAPSAMIVEATNTTGNTWELLFDPTILINEHWSHDGDGDIAQHFPVGTLLRLQKWDTYDVEEVTGVVTAVVGNLVTADLDDTWEPVEVGEGAIEPWLAEFQRNTGGALATADQQRYAYVGTVSGLLSTTKYNRRMA